MSAHSPPGSTSDHPGRGVRVVTGDDWRLTTAPLRSKMQALMVVVPTSRESTWSDDMMMRDLSMECCFLARWDVVINVGQLFACTSWTVAQFGIQVLNLTAQELVVELDSPWACYWTWLPVNPLLQPAGVFLEYAQTFVANWRLRIAHRGGLSEGHSLIPSLTLGPRSSYRTLQDRDVLCA